MLDILKTGWALLKSQISFVKYLYNYGKKFVELLGDAKTAIEEKQA